ncbi:cyclase [Tumebacillus algifaecis]|uniref:Cyclase n=1 Tax=Tumebacillus algifaecis TaxID=1214604 RepID=A0A223D059_9BACL|nr:aromatase/cyclase [Tumebacillus algifaecis]ASS74875.1 cyclase [Tumebacillus algifaecis]
MPSVEVTALITGDRNRVYGLISDMESYPRFMPSLNRLEVVDKGEGWTMTSWDTSISGMNFRWLERDEFDQSNYRITYRQVTGDLKQFEGEWRVEEADGQCKVTLTVDFDFGVPMLSTLLNPVASLKLRQNGEAMLRAIKSRCETGFH